MLSVELRNGYYRALIAKDPEYNGVFYGGVMSTEFFCRSVCSARIPKFENCEFYKTAEEALLAGFYYETIYSKTIILFIVSLSMEAKASSLIVQLSVLANI